jgi:hypothetical protein
MINGKATIIYYVPENGLEKIVTFIQLTVIPVNFYLKLNEYEPCF